MFASIQKHRLATLWDELVSGSCKIESWSYADDEWSMVVSRHAQPAGDVERLRPRDVEILERALLSGVRKHVAMEVGLSCSTIAVIMQTCFQYMGLSCRPSRIPGLLVAAAYARHSQPPKCQHGSTPPAGWAFPDETIRVPRPDAELSAWLAPAEHAVIHLLIEGMSYAEIAEARHTSVRTVANQVAAGFRRLDVSGRAELLCLLARWGLARPERPTRRPPSVMAPPARRGSSRGARRTESSVTPQDCLSPLPAS
jgi:DNA-binding NarL/FixJ family response regulator